MKYLVRIERGETSWGAYVPNLPGCVAVAKSRDEVATLIREALNLHLEDMLQHGRIEIPTQLVYEIVEEQV